MTEGKIAIIDYGMGNLRSVEKAFEFVNAPIFVTSDPDKVLNAVGVVVPGVGAFKDAMEHLRSRGMDKVIIEAAAQNKPMLGICLGMELFFSSSMEGGYSEGLGIIPGEVLPFESEDLKIPHMGWNFAGLADRHRSSGTEPDAVMRDIGESAYFYFVHSFYCKPADENDILTLTDYGISFASAIKRGNLYAFQYHPEKSSKAGLTIIENFSKLCFSQLVSQKT